VGVFVVCALAAQQQSEPADEAVEVNANYTLMTHNHNNYTYRPKECKTFLGKIPRRPVASDVEDSLHISAALPR
jgi:hypothetical protein